MADEQADPADTASPLLPRRWRWLDTLSATCGLVGGTMFLIGMSLRGDGEEFNAVMAAGVAVVAVGCLLALPGMVQRYRWARSAPPDEVARAKALAGRWTVPLLLAATVGPLLIVVLGALLSWVVPF